MSSNKIDLVDILIVMRNPKSKKCECCSEVEVAACFEFARLFIPVFGGRAIRFEIFKIEKFKTKLDSHKQ